MVVFAEVPFEESAEAPSRQELLDIGRDAVTKRTGISRLRRKAPTPEVRTRHGHYWWAVSGEEPPKQELRGDYAFFDIGAVLEFVIEAGAAGVIGNRLDALVMALKRKADLARRTGRSEPLTREQALRRALAATCVAWPEGAPKTYEVAYGIPQQHAHVIEETHHGDGRWSFTFHARRLDREAETWEYRTDTTWLYTVDVPPDDEDDGFNVLALTVNRRRTAEP
ncbi:hypothetical protein ACI784_10915 [Geodermatophilus sp. SYSU D01186]